MLAVHTDTRILYALKVVPKAKITTQKQVDQILAESKILKCVHIYYGSITALLKYNEPAKSLVKLLEQCVQKLDLLVYIGLVFD